MARRGIGKEVDNFVKTFMQMWKMVQRDREIELREARRNAPKEMTAAERKRYEEDQAIKKAGDEGEAAAGFKTSGGGRAESYAALPGEAREVEDRFMSPVKQELTNPYGLAAVAATGRAESSWKPTALTGDWSDPSESGGAGRSGGAMSWRNERLSALRATGDLSPEGNGKFFVEESKKNGLLDRLQNAKSLDEAMGAINKTWAFAGYNKPGHHEPARRMGYAQEYLKKYGGPQDASATPKASPTAQALPTEDQEAEYTSASVAPEEENLSAQWDAEDQAEEGFGEEQLSFEDGGAVPTSGWSSKGPDARGSVFVEYARANPRPAPAPSPAPAPAAAPAANRVSAGDRFRALKAERANRPQAPAEPSYEFDEFNNRVWNANQMQRPASGIPSAIPNDTRPQAPWSPTTSYVYKPGMSGANASDAERAEYYGGLRTDPNGQYAIRPPAIGASAAEVDAYRALPRASGAQNVLADQNWRQTIDQNAYAQQNTYQNMWGYAEKGGLIQHYEDGGFVPERYYTDAEIEQMRTPSSGALPERNYAAGRGGEGPDYAPNPYEPEGAYRSERYIPQDELDRMGAPEGGPAIRYAGEGGGPEGGRVAYDESGSPASRDYQEAGAPEGGAIPARAAPAKGKVTPKGKAAAKEPASADPRPRLPQNSPEPAAIPASAQSPMQDSTTSDRAGSGAAWRSGMEGYDPNYLVNPQGVSQAATAGMGFLQKFFGFDQQRAALPGTDPQRQAALTAFANNEGAPTVQEIKTIDKTIDPEGKLTAEMRPLARMWGVYKMYEARGDMQGAARMAGSMMLHSRRVLATGGIAVERMIKSGNFEGAAKVMEQTKPEGIPDGQRLKVTPEKGGQFKMELFDADGQLTQQGRYGVDQILKYATGMQNGTVWFQKFGELSQGGGRARVGATAPKPARVPGQTADERRDARDAERTVGAIKGVKQEADAKRAEVDQQVPQVAVPAGGPADAADRRADQTREQVGGAENREQAFNVLDAKFREQTKGLAKDSVGRRSNSSDEDFVAGLGTSAIGKNVEKMPPAVKGTLTSVARTALAGNDLSDVEAGRVVGDMFAKGIDMQSDGTVRPAGSKERGIYLDGRSVRALMDARGEKTTSVKNTPSLADAILESKRMASGLASRDPAPKVAGPEAKAEAGRRMNGRRADLPAADASPTSTYDEGAAFDRSVQRERGAGRVSPAEKSRQSREQARGDAERFRTDRAAELKRQQEFEARRSAIPVN